MARLLSQVHGRTPLKQVLNLPSPTSATLNKFHVEPFKATSYQLGAQYTFYEAGMARLWNVSRMTLTPFFEGAVLHGYAPGTGLASLNTFAKNNAWKVALVVTAVKGMSADILAQKLFEGKEQLDYRRTGLFFAFAAFYSGCICHGLWTWVYPTLFSTRFASFNALGSTLFDNMVNTPFIFFPTFYAMKECLLAEAGNLASAFHKWKSEVFEATIASWKMWFPAHIITFGLMPVHMRIPFASIVSFFYFTLVSLQQSQFDKRRIENEIDDSHL